MFEDESFSFDRLKSFFLRSFCAWATLILDVDFSFVRGIYCILWFVRWVVSFCSSPFFVKALSLPQYILYKLGRLTLRLFCVYYC